MTEGWTPEERLRAAREREHVVSAIAKALSDWRTVLDVIASSATTDDARSLLSRNFGFSEAQAAAVLDMQFRRVTAVDRDRVAAELVSLQREIKELEDGE